jgi:hypothetical protein
VRFLADEDFDFRIVQGVLRRLPRFDVVRAQDTTGQGTPDPDVLKYAADEGRLVLTHDVSTMIDAAYQRAAAGLPMPGVIAVSQREPLGPVIESLVLLIADSVEGEWGGQVVYLPFK